MTLNLRMPEQPELKPRITVFGVGGAGGNAVNNMIEKELDGVEFVVANTDAQALQQAKSLKKPLPLAPSLREMPGHAASSLQVAKHQVRLRKLWSTHSVWKLC